MASKWAVFVEGAKLLSQGAFATWAWGLVTGVAIVQSGLSVGQALGMTFLVYAGSAQLAALPLIAVGVPVWLVLATATVVNLRFVIYSALLVPWFGPKSLFRRLFYGYLMTDLAMAKLIEWQNRHAGSLAPLPGQAPSDSQRQHYRDLYLGSAAANWVAWQSASVLGILLASQIPVAWSLGFGGTLALLALVLPMLTDRAMVACAVASGVAALAFRGLPLKLGLVIAVLAGVVAAMLMPSKPQERP